MRNPGSGDADIVDITPSEKPASQLAGKKTASRRSSATRGATRKRTTRPKPSGVATSTNQEPPASGVEEQATEAVERVESEPA